MFSCDISNGDFLFWIVNGTFFSDLSSEILSDIDINSGGIPNGLNTLDITARAVYNGTTVQCVTGEGASRTRVQCVTGDVYTVCSENVTLTIQGIHTANDTYNTTQCHVLTT